MVAHEQIGCKCGNCHAEHHAHTAHGAKCSGRDAVKALVHRTHSGIRVRRREQPKSYTQNQQTPDNEIITRICIKKFSKNKPITITDMPAEASRCGSRLSESRPATDETTDIMIGCAMRIAPASRGV